MVCKLFPKYNTWIANSFGHLVFVLLIHRIPNLSHFTMFHHQTSNFWKSPYFFENLICLTCVFILPYMQVLYVRFVFRLLFLLRPLLQRHVSDNPLPPPRNRGRRHVCHRLVFYLLKREAYFNDVQHIRHQSLQSEILALPDIFQ